MHNRYKVLIGTIVLLILAITCASLGKEQPYRSGQEKLAKELGVEISNYPDPDRFPTGYFKQILREGMTPEDVHAVVRGYDKVLRCNSAFEEVYYYFGTSDSQALRFAVEYDMNLKYLNLTTEDDDSRTIYVEGCTPGLLTK